MIVFCARNNHHPNSHFDCKIAIARSNAIKRYQECIHKSQFAIVKRNCAHQCKCLVFGELLKSCILLHVLMMSNRWLCHIYIYITMPPAYSFHFISFHFAYFHVKCVYFNVYSVIFSVVVIFGGLSYVHQKLNLKKNNKFSNQIKMCS